MHKRVTRKRWRFNMQTSLAGLTDSVMCVDGAVQIRELTILLGLNEFLVDLQGFGVLAGPWLSRPGRVQQI